MALAFGGLIVVEPLLVMSLPFAVGLRPLSAREPAPAGRDRQRAVRRRAEHLPPAARPTPGHGKVTLAEAWPVALGLAVAIAGSLTLALLTRDNWRAIGFAPAAAAFYGATAASVEVATTRSARASSPSSRAGPSMP